MAHATLPTSFEPFETGIRATSESRSNWGVRPSFFVIKIEFRGTVRGTFRGTAKNQKSKRNVRIRGTFRGTKTSKKMRSNGRIATK